MSCVCSTASGKHIQMWSGFFVKFAENSTKFLRVSCVKCGAIIQFFMTLFWSIWFQTMNTFDIFCPLPLVKNMCKVGRMRAIDHVITRFAFSCCRINLFNRFLGICMYFYIYRPFISGAAKFRWTTIYSFLML